MTEIAVERKKRTPWWPWLIGLLLALVVAWFWFQSGPGDRERIALPSSPPPVAVSTSPVAPTPSPTSTAPLNPAAAPAAAVGATPSNPSAFDTGLYAATADKGSLVGREAGLTGAKVVRIVGPKTFTVASANEELFVVIDEGLSTGVGSQGQIGVGDSVDVKGSFQRLDQEAIRDLSARRYRALTPPERETLSKTQVYLHATTFDRRN